MKKILAILGLIFLLTGCSAQSGSMEGITVYTSAYPIEYITSTLYGDNSTVYSIYPTGTNINNYKLTTNQIENYAKSSSLFVYNGLMGEGTKTAEVNYAATMLKSNSDIKIIDAAKGMEYSNNVEEIWLNPSNMLMMANNVMSGLKEYITNPYLVKSIKTNYTELQLALSALDADYKNMYENASTTTIVVSSDTFKFLTKYNFNVISLEENSNLTAKTISDVKKLINNGTVKYIYVRDDEKINSTIANLLTATTVKTLEIYTMTSISQTQRDEKEDYVSIMKSNLLQFQMEVYK